MSEEKNGELASKEEQPKEERKFKQEQYDRLIEYSKKWAKGIDEWNQWAYLGIEEWNQWRRENKGEEIWLEGAKLFVVNLQRANFMKANLQRASLMSAKLQWANFYGANLQWANFHGANLQETDLRFANLQGANFYGANLQSANFMKANLQWANFYGANLQGANLKGAKFQGAEFRGVILNGATNFLDCKIDGNTDFRHTTLENACIDSGAKILLKYNIRRMNWGEWYKKHKVLQWPVKWFWLMSDYGISTLRIMAWFIAFAVGFSLVYFLQPGCVMVNGVVGDVRGFLHAFYFSVVTMTTLGFGDIAANPDSWLGQVVLMAQVILGYVLLGALITRLAVLFTSDGPAGSFTPMDEDTKKLLVKLEEEKKGKGKGACNE